MGRRSSTALPGGEKAKVQGPKSAESKLIQANPTFEMQIGEGWDGKLTGWKPVPPCARVQNSELRSQEKKRQAGCLSHFYASGRGESG